tara:strand:- start:2386 stop:2670 length:285 start_codon:yes stop_codon:yes gene_type:complete
MAEEYVPQIIDEPIRLGSIPVGKNAEVRGSIKEWRGKLKLDLRLFARSPESDGFYPTRKGVNVSISDMDAVAMMIKAAKTELAKLPFTEVPAKK